MSQQRLTDRTLAPYVDKDSLIHIVNTGDTIQYSGGSSYKTTLESLIPIFSGGSSYGIFGISDNTGLYTYYSTLQDAIDNSVSGDTIQMFSNYVETNPVTVDLKDGVDINMNGYYYYLLGNNGFNCLSDRGNIVRCSIYNGNIVRSGTTYVNDSQDLCLRVQNLLSVIKTVGVYFKSYETTSINNSGTIYGAIVNGYTRGIVNGGKLYSVNVTSDYETAIYCDSTNSEVYDSIGRSNGFGYGIGMLMPSLGGILMNSVGYGLGQSGIYVSNTNRVQSCIGFSSSNSGMSSLGSLVNDCKGYSSASAGFYSISGYFYSDILGYSYLTYGSYITANVTTSVEFLNLTSESLGGTGVYFGSTSTGNLVIKNIQAASHISGSSGRACEVSGNNNIIIMGGSMSTASGGSSADCFYSVAPITVKYSNLSFKVGTGSAVNANITQGITNVVDNQGNIII
jgi:hypothetical protein